MMSFFAFLAAHQAVIGLVILAGLFIFFLLDRWHTVVVALAGVSAFILLGFLDRSSMLSAFANPAPIAIGAFFVLSGALVRTGAIDWLGDRIVLRARQSPRLALAELLLGAFFLSAFVNNTPVVLVLIPIMLRLSVAVNTSPQQLLLPLSFVSILGGTTTLIGSSTNLIVDGVVQANDLEGFGLFEITPYGIAASLAGALALLVLGPMLLPKGPREAAQPAPVPVPGVEDAEPVKRGKALTAAAILILVVLSAATGVLPISMAAVLGVALVLITGCLSPSEAWRSINGDVLVLILAMLAIGAALDQAGSVDLLADSLMPWLQTVPPWALIFTVYFSASILTEVITNNAVAVVMTPVAIGLAEQLGTDPRPLVIAVMLAASASFATPVGYQTNTMVYAAGGYRFADFARIGIPMNIVVGVATCLALILV